MFSSALKSISSTPITANYALSPTPTSSAGPWKIYDGKKKSTGKTYSVFVLDKKSLETHSRDVGRSGQPSFRRSVDEVVERLKKEASSLAKLRHPSILELVEPVEETRGGGLQFVTEAVTASLSALLQDKDEQEKVGGRSSRFVTEDADGTRRRREIEMDELEIQKGLLQISKALEFLHENAGLVHGNLTPDAILINAKSDWKLSGLAFCSPAEGSRSTSSIPGISLSEMLNPDPRLPRAVQLNLDYTSPDFVLDSNLTPSADMFSLGLLSVALYNSPHRSPLDCHGSVSTYRRAFSSSSTTPTAANNYLSSRPLPKDLAQHVLPRLVARRPAQRMTAREFQASEYFDNILVSTIRFLDTFPAKTAQEKTQFLRGLVKVLPSFPRSVMEKKLLPALLDEMKDKDLLSAILQNVFKIVSLLPSARRAFGDKVRPALKSVFVDKAKPGQEKDAARDAGLMVFLEQIALVADNCNGKEFKEDILPVIMAAIECPTPSIVDVALRSLPVVLPVLDFSTIKNELFPVVAAMFSKTNSLAIKVRGLQAFAVLCGGSSDDSGLDGIVADSKMNHGSSSALDKYTMQDKIIPLVRAIKTKEPAVMMAARDLMLIIGQSADADFIAMDMLPILWSMSLGPLLNLAQFRSFMALIRDLSRRVEDEQTKKLQELSGSLAPQANDDLLVSATANHSLPDAGPSDDFEALVKGRRAASSWDEAATLPPSATHTPQPPSFSWSTPPPPSNPSNPPPGRPAVPKQDLAKFESMTTSTQFSQPLKPSSTQFSQPLKPSSTQFSQPLKPTSAIPSSSTQFNPAQFSQSLKPPSSSSINWSSAAPNFSLAPPPSSSLSPPPSAPRQTSWSIPAPSSMNQQQQQQQQQNHRLPTTLAGISGSPSAVGTQQKSGLDKYESLI